MNWHYVERGQQIGPVSEEQLAELAGTGKINAETLVWREGMADWQPYREVKSELKSSVAPDDAGETIKTTEAVCSECGKMFPMDEMIRHGSAYICAGCKPVFMQKLAEGAQINTGGLNYAGFGIRFGAKFLDCLILGLPFMCVYLLVLIPQARARTPSPATFLPLFIQLGFVLIQMAYQIFFLGKYGATPGKMICKLKVVTADGDRISYGRATGRFFAEMLSGMICYIGYFMIAFDKPQRRALHDYICNTRVVYK